MSSYYYVKDSDSEFGYTPIPEEEYIMAVSRICRQKGAEIRDRMILKEVEKMWKKRRKGSWNGISFEHR